MGNNPMNVQLARTQPSLDSVAPKAQLVSFELPKSSFRTLIRDGISGNKLSHERTRGV